MEEAIKAIGRRSESPDKDLLKEGFIQRFEFTHELAWKVMKDYLEYQGHTDIRGSRDAFRKALSIGIIETPLWIDSIQTRNITSHTYDEDIIDTTFQTIMTDYYPMMKDFETVMSELMKDETV